MTLEGQVDARHKTRFKELINDDGASGTGSAAKAAELKTE